MIGLGEKDEAMFRSAEMSMVHFYIPQEISRDSVYIVGQLGLVQFLDLNHKTKSFQRTFVNDIRRLDNVQRQYRYFYKLLQKHSLKVFAADEGKSLVAAETMMIPPTTAAIDDHVQNAQFLEERLLQMEDASEQLEEQKADLEQFRHVLRSSDAFFAIDGTQHQQIAVQTTQPSTEIDDIERQFIDQGASLPDSVNYVTGVISREKIPVFEQILWRVLRGNLYFKHTEIEEPIYDKTVKDKVAKNAFIVFSPGDLIIQRIKKIAESLDAKLYDVGQTSNMRSKQLIEVNQNLDDLYTVLQTTNTTLESELYAIAKELNYWLQDISREKAVFEALNKFNFDNNRKILIAEGWIPSDELVVLQDRLDQMTANLGVDVPSIVQVLKTSRTPPTYHRTNKFTEAFQAICDCYGIAQYREINPGLPTIVTFPFMFAIMFGDMGHGFIMFLAALALVLNENKIAKMKRDDISDMAYTGRYMVLLMGAFSMYTGFLYNDIFSKSMTFFKSGWKWPEKFEPGQTVFAEPVGTYPIGLDYAWHGAENDLLFTNSYKMKLSILMGFIHMSYSYMFSLVNHIYFNSWIDIVGNFIPGFLFMHGIFGYLAVCIVYKWSVDWIKDGKVAPSLLNMLINMFLAPGKIDDPLYPYQDKIQMALLFIALICIPWLLAVKPIYYKIKLSKKYNAVPTTVTDELEQLLPDVDIDGGAGEDGEAGGHGAEENLGDIVIHQVIHTIEFCLNCVSHTASYLRLWALSLAHSQLSNVLWSMTIAIGFKSSGTLGVISIVFLFAMWFVLTVCVLVVMEGTSAMLHSLRLHWVESMSKFFVGEGLPYEPFNFPTEDIEDFGSQTTSATAAATA
ncbi:hypothetical protein Kpol_1064p32 [Vanderwaltozyma polyspora DSM 70294]|uniref:V-type proton ATPase subunit a n=1 Tax=Vanderwaltozyma polyspora (strain ATCC 22028 / DSM 70294 / BCRC 21397 / CBS 2163 / NBRC 10782 / NRRL Y-8283 / UCD 57-17) TaxID=436907 RepID=A7TMF6_VANPO|nr:uncharacterized protein Kpol_1064p32 [Vanderwaltozyma polyspora DSM 70294]EDO16550.1 hypothetical protein Kpol_1064p32 [Vanderwaltozyma polyspora DSM 70294]